MTAVDSTVREFSISFYQPTTIKAVFFCVALAGLLAAGTWLGMRLYLHLFGARAEGKVIESTVKMHSVKGNELSISRFVYTRHLKIEFTGPDGVTRTLKGRHYSNKDLISKMIQPEAESIVIPSWKTESSSQGKRTMPSLAPGSRQSLPE